MRARVGGFILIFLTIALLSSCRGFFQPEDNTNNGGGGGGGTTTAKFAYVANSQGGSVSGFTVASDGTLTAMSGSPFQGGALQPTGLAVDSTGNFLFVADESTNANQIVAFRIDRSTGAIGSASTAPALTAQPFSVAVSPNGSFLYVLAKGLPTATTPVNGDVEPYTISTQGVPAPITGTQQTLALDPWAVTVDASGKFVFVAGGASGTWVFNIQTATPAGTLTKASQLSTITGISHDVAIDPTTTFAYVANGSTGVETYQISTTGTLSHIGGVTPAGSSPNRVAVTPNGKFAYVVNQSSNTVSQYSITNGTLTSLGNPAQTGAGPNSIAIDPSSAFVYVTNFTDGTLSVFSISSTGTLTAKQTVSVGAGPSAVVVSK